MLVLVAFQVNPKSENVTRTSYYGTLKQITHKYSTVQTLSEGRTL